jgi:L-seryl-tRNA(Ser) seleniumtransferase
LARAINVTGLPHAVCVELARQAIAEGPTAYEREAAINRGKAFAHSLLGPVINATGVLLHTNLGRAPMGLVHPSTAINLEFDLATGERGSRQQSVGSLLAMACGAEAAIVVNNNASAVLLVLAAIARDRQVLVSRGESVEIGGGFRVADVAAILKVHPSNYRVEGFVETTDVADLVTLGVPVIADIGSGLIDANCPWLPGPPPTWLHGEPAARQTLEHGAALVTFSGDKLFGGPQAGIIAGRADLVEKCEQHPLARALRPGAHVMVAVQRTTMAYLGKTAATDIAFWTMVAASRQDLERRAADIIAAAGIGEIEPTLSVPGAGSAPGETIPSIGIRVAGDHLDMLRTCDPPIVARTRDGSTWLDLRTIDPRSDDDVAAALKRCV